MEFEKELMGLICPGYYCTCQENTHFYLIGNLCITFHINNPLGLQVLMTPYSFYKLPKQLKFPPDPYPHQCFDYCNRFSSGLGEHCQPAHLHKNTAAKSIFQFITAT